MPRVAFNAFFHAIPRRKCIGLGKWKSITPLGRVIEALPRLDGLGMPWYLLHAFFHAIPRRNV
jgi:hypothetical protein